MRPGGLPCRSIEDEYVTKASPTRQCSGSVRGSTRLCPAATRFLAQLPQSSLVVDIGCGENKYDLLTGYMLGVDPCSEILIKNRCSSTATSSSNSDLALGDALRLPFRSGIADGVLLVSVLHHLATAARRHAALLEMSRVMRPGSRALIVVWALEQPNATFPSQDVLVPWNLHEISINGRLPRVRFHMKNTKEQRIIQASIPVSMCDDDKPTLQNSATRWFNWLIERVKFLTSRDRTIVLFDSYASTGSPAPSCSPDPPIPTAPTDSSTPVGSSTLDKMFSERNLPRAFPSFLPQKRKSFLLGIHRWSPNLAKKLASLMTPIEEIYAEELTEQILQEALNECIAATKDVSFFRYYHVFRKGELESLLETIPSLTLIYSAFENGNWNVVVERKD